VEWLSFPCFDSPSVFGRLLGADAGALEHHAEPGLDKHPPLRGPDNGGHRLGMNVPHLLLRRVAFTSGSVEVNISYAQRPEYGLVVPLLAPVDGGVTARGGAEWLVLTAPVSLHLNRGAAAVRPAVAKLSVNVS
jgi:hypothetical protein